MILHSTAWGERYPRTSHMIDGMLFGLLFGLVIGHTLWGS